MFNLTLLKTTIDYNKISSVFWNLTIPVSIMIKLIYFPNEGENRENSISHWVKYNLQFVFLFYFWYTYSNNLIQH